MVLLIGGTIVHYIGARPKQKISCYYYGTPPLRPAGDFRRDTVVVVVVAKTYYYIYYYYPSTPNNALKYLK